MVTVEFVWHGWLFHRGGSVLSAYSRVASHHTISKLYIRITAKTHPRNVNSHIILASLNLFPPFPACPCLFGRFDVGWVWGIGTLSLSPLLFLMLMG